MDFFFYASVKVLGMLFKLFFSSAEPISTDETHLMGGFNSGLLLETRRFSGC